LFTLTDDELENVVGLPIKVNPEPPLDATHFKPVASALSATILQEQSQRIVPLA